MIILRGVDNYLQVSVRAWLGLWVRAEGVRVVRKG